MTADAGLTLASFAAHREQAFALAADPEAPALTLVEARALAAASAPAAGLRPGFSLLFAGPIALDQGLYSLRHPTLGVLDLFLVPVGPSTLGLSYEAVFN